MTEISGFPRIETLKSGLAVTIRALRVDDREKIAAAVRESRPRIDLFPPVQLPERADRAGLDRIMAVDRPGEVVLVVTEDTGDARVIGSGRYVAAAAAGTERTAEVAFVVEETSAGRESPDACFGISPASRARAESPH